MGTKKLPTLLRLAITAGLLFFVLWTTPYLNAQDGSQPILQNHAGLPAIEPPPGEPATPPFAFPFVGLPGPNSWQLVTTLPNRTNVAYQGLVFKAACGAEIVAIGDGVVSEVDGAHAVPHSLMLDHPSGYSSLYSGLPRKPALEPGQSLTEGAVIAIVGDAAGPCPAATIRLQIYNNLHTRSYNTARFIQPQWGNLAHFAR